MSEQATSSWNDAKSKTYTIHPETTAYNQTVNNTKKAEARAKISCGEISLDDYRQQIAEPMKSVTPTNEFAGSVTRLTVSDLQVPVDVYTPSNLPQVPTILVFYHGGGLILGSAASWAGPPRYLAEETGVIVVNVDYRLLPNKSDPYAPFTDSIAATRWVIDNPSKVGGASGSKVGVAGDSAGGQIVSIVCSQVKEIDFQVLIYGMLDVDCNHPCVQEFSGYPGFNREDFKWICDLILEDVPDWKVNRKFNPAAIPDLDLRGQPPALLVVAELDPLRDFSCVYAGRLEKAGVATELVMVKGVPHGFMFERTSFPETFVQGYSHVIKFIKSFQ